MFINWGQSLLINILNKESGLFRSISSVSLLLSLYEISHHALHAAKFNSLKSHMFDCVPYAILPWPNNTTLYSSVSPKFGAFYIMGHWAGFRIKTQIYVFICFLAFFCCFLSLDLCFYYSNFFFWWSIKFP